MQSFGPIRNYFSKEKDRGLILGELGGSLTKCQANRYHWIQAVGFRSGGPDLFASGSNRGRLF